MRKNDLLATFSDRHLAFIAFIQTLTDTQFTLALGGKWSPGQQIEHIYLCLKPMERALGSKAYLMEKFGKLNRAELSYDQTIQHYLEALQNGGKAPAPFVPPAVDLARKQELIELTQNLVSSICERLNGYSEDELSQIVMPHPLLGNLNIREFMYMMSYHATHHLNQTKQNLA
jgi:hypothetical protein